MSRIVDWVKGLSVLAAHRTALVFWLFPGAIISWLLKDVLSWTAFMSWYAIVVTHWAAQRADKPTPGVDEKESNG